MGNIQDLLSLGLELACHYFHFIILSEARYIVNLKVKGWENSSTPLADEIARSHGKNIK